MSDIKLFFAGDFCSKPSSSLIQVSKELGDLIASCDLRVVNFEVPLKPGANLPERLRERFFQNDDVPQFLKTLGFDLFSMANNHAFDWGDEGWLKTKEALGDGVFGAGTYNEAYKVKTVEVKGKRIGFLALSFSAYNGVFDDVMDHDGYGCAYIYDLKVNHVILEAKKDVDYLFVLPHDGIEYIDVPLPETIARYRDFIEYGADGVIASHPHCPQGWEAYQGKPIFYSLGNFFFNSKESPDFRCTKPHWYEGRCVVLNIGGSGISFEVVNTRNVDNVGIEIDHNDKSLEHNHTVCGYLKDRTSYESYLFPKLKEQFDKNMRIIDETVHSDDLGVTMKSLWKCVRRKVCRRPQPSDNRLKRIFSHDLFRYTTIRMIGKKIK